jgi:hypothetical protein
MGSGDLRSLSAKAESRARRIASTDGRDSMSETRTHKEKLDNDSPIDHFSSGDGRAAAAQRRFSNQQNQWRPRWMRRSLENGCGPRATAVG